MSLVSAAPCATGPDRSTGGASGTQILGDETMQLPRARFTVRSLVVAVALIACLITVEAMRRRGHDFRERAEFHKGEIYGIEDEIPPDPENRWETLWFLDDSRRQPPAPDRFYPAGRFAPSDDDPPVIVEWRKSQARRITYHDMMYRKYRRAAARPWLVVAPDPREPK